jgi:hypothetical protein
VANSISAEGGKHGAMILRSSSITCPQDLCGKLQVTGGAVLVVGGSVSWWCWLGWCCRGCAGFEKCSRLGITPQVAWSELGPSTYEHNGQKQSKECKTKRKGAAASSRC